MRLCSTFLGTNFTTYNFFLRVFQFYRHHIAIESVKSVQVILERVTISKDSF